MLLSKLWISEKKKKVKNQKMDKWDKPLWDEYIEKIVWR